jgi:pyruvate/2-oxoglutarate dehydrogenase complex dihydrolipoamide dehydrogenase (E3) component
MNRDVIVIGSGQAGVPLAARLAEAGRDVVLLERRHLGGTCVNYGCTPTKTMIASAGVAHAARTAGAFGVEVGDVRVDLAAVVERKEAMVREWRESVESRLERAGDRLTVVHGHGRFVGPRTIAAGDAEYTADTVIVNTGARPVQPPVPSLDEVDWLDNARLMELRTLPRHLLVIGGGYIGCELGQAFRRFGAEVTVVERNDHLLAREDPDISEAVEAVFRDEGIELRLGATVRSVAGTGDGVRLSLDDEELSGSHLLVATGRRPNTDDLGIDAAGLEVDDRGAILVDDHYRTSVDGVYAVGDVTGGAQFTHTSWDDHRILFDLLEGDGHRTRADRVIPYAVFTDPQVGRVGLSEEEARRQGRSYEVASMPFRHVARAREAGREAGIMKVLVDPGTERILGASLVGAEAAELIHVFVTAMSADAPARAIVEAEAVHPAYAEGLHTLLMQLDRYGF